MAEISHQLEVSYAHDQARPKELSVDQNNMRAPKQLHSMVHP
jgi:hypothetical protein